MLLVPSLLAVLAVFLVGVRRAGAPAFRAAFPLMAFIGLLVTLAGATLRGLVPAIPVHGAIQVALYSLMLAALEDGLRIASMRKLVVAHGFPLEQASGGLGILIASAESLATAWRMSSAPDFVAQGGGTLAGLLVLGVAARVAFHVLACRVEYLASLRGWWCVAPLVVLHAAANTGSRIGDAYLDGPVVTAASLGMLALAIAGFAAYARTMRLMAGERGWAASRAE